MLNNSQTTVIIKGVLDNHLFPTVGDWAFAFEKYKKDGKNEVPADLVTQAESLFRQLVRTSAEPVLCHGDLHHDNILSSSRDEWLVIDPKGVAAEPAYEVAAMIRNPHRKLKHIKNLKPLLELRLNTLAKELEHNPTRILQWCFAQTVLSALWSVEGGVKTPSHALRVAEALNSIDIN